MTKQYQNFLKLSEIILAKTSNKNLSNALQKASQGSFEEMIYQFEEKNNYQDFFKIEKENQDLYQNLFDELPNFIKIIWLNFKGKFEIGQKTTEEKLRESFEKTIINSEF